MHKCQLLYVLSTATSVVDSTTEKEQGVGATVLSCQEALHMMEGSAHLERWLAQSPWEQPLQLPSGCHSDSQFHVHQPPRLSWWKETQQVCGTEVMWVDIEKQAQNSK